MHFYINEFPKVGDYVITLITEITERGYTCELLEYDNIISYVKHSDISTQKIRNLKDLRKHSSVNSIEVMEIKELDKDYISLNRKYLDSELKHKTMENYNLYSKIYNFIYNNNKLNLSEEIKYTTIKTIQNCKNILEEILTQDIILNIPLLYDFFSSLIIPKNIDIELINKYDFKFLNFTNIYKFNEYCKRQLMDQDVILEYKNLRQNIFTLKSKTYLKLEKFKEIEKVIMLYNEKIEPEINILTNTKYKNLTTPILNLGIIGHVSHGKTTIIHRLTGIDTKKYKKEMQKGMTLKLGYTNAWISECFCDSCIDDSLPIQEVCFAASPKYIAEKCNNINNNCQSYLISIIDCPGHSVLMNTMLSGASIMDTAMLIIAGDEQCPQPQTEDHLLAITINDKKDKGFEHGIVIQNKLDLIPIKSAIEHKNTISKFLKETILENAPIIPISAQKDINIDLIVKWIYTFCTEKSKDLVCSITSEISNNIFCKGIIVRTFDVNKVSINMNENISGLILGGSILEGELLIGQSIIILPQNIKTKIYEIKTGETILDKAQRGGLIGFKTDLNPYNADNYIGSFIINEKDYNEKFIFEENSTIKLKIKIKEGCQKLFKILKNIDINVWGKDLKNCNIIDFYKKYITIKLTTKLYLDPRLVTQITFLHKNSIIGFATIVEGPEITQNEKEGVVVEGDNSSCILKYNKLLNDNYNNNLKHLENELEYQRCKTKTDLLKLPNPKVIFRNKSTFICNFIDITQKINSCDPFILGNFIKKELGMKGVSLNEKELILKGRTNENCIQKILTKYLLENVLCKNCLSKETNIIKKSNCKFLHCEKCNHESLV